MLRNSRLRLAPPASLAEHGLQAPGKSGLKHALMDVTPNLTKWSTIADSQIPNAQSSMIIELSACAECKQAAMSGMGEPLKRLATSEGPIFLYRCRKCGTLWEENLREAHPITGIAAKERFNYWTE